MKLMIRHSGNRMARVQIRDGVPIRQLLEPLVSGLGLDFGQYSPALVFSGTILHPDQTLSEASVLEGCELELVRAPYVDRPVPRDPIEKTALRQDAMPILAGSAPEMLERWAKVFRSLGIEISADMFKSMVRSSPSLATTVQKGALAISTQRQPFLCPKTMEPCLEHTPVDAGSIAVVTTAARAAQVAAQIAPAVEANGYNTLVIYPGDSQSLDEPYWVCRACHAIADSMALILDVTECGDFTLYLDGFARSLFRPVIPFVVDPEKDVADWASEDPVKLYEGNVEEQLSSRIEENLMFEQAPYQIDDPGTHSRQPLLEGTLE